MLARESLLRVAAAILIGGLAACDAIPRVAVEADGALVTSEDGTSVALAKTTAWTMETSHSRYA